MQFVFTEYILGPDHCHKHVGDGLLTSSLYFINKEEGSMIRTQGI